MGNRKANEIFISSIYINKNNSVSIKLKMIIPTS